MRSTTRGRKFPVDTGTKDTPLRDSAQPSACLWFLEKGSVLFGGSLAIVPLSLTSPSLLYHLGGLIALGGFGYALMSLWPLLWHNSFTRFAWSCQIHISGFRNDQMSGHTPLARPRRCHVKSRGTVGLPSARGGWRNWPPNSSAMA